VERGSYARQAARRKEYAAVKKTHVDGRHAADVLIYALSTCGWCRKTKELLKELGVEYDYIDVDALEPDDYEQVKAEIQKWNPMGSFPTIIVDDRECIIGFQEDKIRSVAER